MSNIKMMFAILIFGSICACSVFEPFIDRRRNAGETEVSKLYRGKSTPDNPAVCSNGLWTNDQKIQALADAECEKHHPGTHAVLTHKTLLTCKLLLPTHTYFKCEK
ncbi:MAG TPA: hypothetical protein DIC64_00650 [Alphaproteobacteria bacterium]|nr:hypothetical protein [Alphaproteobacteria bacterium]